ncbi:MAG: hypothetical protein OXC31_24675, partial [Spirochaetaceae bacterium]|nr:hypothetical protein [Spirochaetaceae bacterium]
RVADARGGGGRPARGLGPDGSATEAPLTQGRAGSQTKDPDKVGQAGNSKVNTTNQGYQQDR